MLGALAGEVFSLPAGSLHVFLDADSGTVAYNSAGSLHFNLRFFMQVHLGVRWTFTGVVTTLSVRVGLGAAG